MENEPNRDGVTATETVQILSLEELAGIGLFGVCLLVFTILFIILVSHLRKLASEQGTPLNISLFELSATFIGILVTLVIISMVMVGAGDSVSKEILVGWSVIIGFYFGKASGGNQGSTTQVHFPMQPPASGVSGGTASPASKTGDPG